MPDEIDILVVGLGNPGEEYENTPHNLGFMVIDRLAESHGIRITRKENLSKVGLGTIGAQRVALAKPQTFMNLSGPAVKGLLERYGLTPGRLIMVYDELDVPWGESRIKPKGSAAGHNGMKSVIGSLGTLEITARPPGNPSGASHRGWCKVCARAVPAGTEAGSGRYGSAGSRGRGIHNRCRRRKVHDGV